MLDFKALTKIYDVFNGDADGICALIQYRLEYPENTELVTGVKRDIQLLNRVSVTDGDRVNVFDISMQKNSLDLRQLLSAGASVFYVDHHLSGEVPKHKKLKAIINTSSKICTSLLVDQYLKGKYKEWAVVGAFGDNVVDNAEAAAKTLSLSDHQISQLKDLGVSVNYNGYGNSVADLHFRPESLYLKMVQYTSPFDFINDPQSVFQQLQEGYDADMSHTQQLEPQVSDNKVAVYLLPDEPWARRVSGVFGNQLANQNPDRAHAVLSHHSDGGYVVSVRAPQNNLNYAGELCAQFETGGGRKGAAGINCLADSEVERFITRFKATYH